MQSYCLLILLLALSTGPLAPSPVSAQCNAGTCLHGGSCDTSYKGKGFRCLCQHPGLRSYGLKCEVSVRGFFLTSSGSISTTHSLVGRTFNKNSLTVTLEFAAFCGFTVCPFLLIQRTGSQQNLVRAELTQSAPTKIQDPKYLHILVPGSSDAKFYTGYGAGFQGISSKMTLTGDWKNHWKTLSIILQMDGKGLLTIENRLCSFVEKSCLQASTTVAFSGDLQAPFAQSELRIGDVFGCIRNVRINGDLVDLANVAKYNGPSGDLTEKGAEQYTAPFCHLSGQACTTNSPTSSEFLAKGEAKCGEFSQCDGWLNQEGPVPRAGSHCRCRCSPGKRRDSEPAQSSDSCQGSATSQCTKDVPIVSTEKDNFRVSWFLQKGGAPDKHPVKLSVSAFANIEMSVRTQETSADSMLKLGDTLRIRLQNGLLDVCVVSDCYPFPEVPVSDGAWHSLSVIFQGDELSAMLDLKTRLHKMKNPTFFCQTDSYVTPSVELPKSCFRGLRIGDVYMPTGGSDRTHDASEEIKVELSSGASAGPKCRHQCDPECDEPANEVCGDASGSPPKCVCKDKHVRDKDGRCKPAAQPSNPSLTAQPNDASSTAQPNGVTPSPTSNNATSNATSDEGGLLQLLRKRFKHIVVAAALVAIFLAAAVSVLFAAHRTRMKRAGKSKEGEGLHGEEKPQAQETR